MRVYRVAHSTERDGGGFPTGPYTSSPSALPDEATEALWYMGFAHSDDEHPAPEDDSQLGDMRAHDRCGFDSLGALYRWFDGFISTLITCGFRVWVYEVRAARVGKHGQALFDRRDAVLVRNEPLTLSAQLELFEIGAPHGADSGA